LIEVKSALYSFEKMAPIEGPFFYVYKIKHQYSYFILVGTSLLIGKSGITAKGERQASGIVHVYFREKI